MASQAAARELRVTRTAAPVGLLVAYGRYLGFVVGAPGQWCALVVSSRGHQKGATALRCACSELDLLASAAVWIARLAVTRDRGSLRPCRDTLCKRIDLCCTYRKLAASRRISSSSACKYCIITLSALP